MNDITTIHFLRSGGFTGFDLKTTVNINDLPENESAELRNLIRQSQITSTQESLRNLKSKDLFSYTITLEGPGNTFTYLINQQELAPEIEPLIQYLSKLAKKRR